MALKITQTKIAKHTIKVVLEYIKEHTGLELQSNDIKLTRKNNRTWFNVVCEDQEKLYSISKTLTRNLQNSSLVESVAVNGYCKLAIFLKK